MGQRLTQHERMNKVMVLGLHTNKGKILDEFRSKFGVELLEVYGKTISKLVSSGMLSV